MYEVTTMQYQSTAQDNQELLQDVSLFDIDIHVTDAPRLVSANDYNIAGGTNNTCGPCGPTNNTCSCGRC